MIVFDLIYNLLNKLGLFIIIIYLLSMSKTFTKLITQNENSLFKYIIKAFNNFSTA